MYLSSNKIRIKNVLPIQNFGGIQIMRDPDSGNSRGFGFISYDSFEASDSAIEVSLMDANFVLFLY